MGGSRNLERVQERADNLVTSGQKSHRDDSLPPESRFGSAIELLFDMMLGCQLSHEPSSTWRDRKLPAVFQTVLPDREAEGDRRGCRIA
jgi:hypothetical protein